MRSKVKVHTTEHSGQARRFARRATAVRWAKASGGKVLPVAGFFVVYVNGKGWVK